MRKLLVGATLLAVGALGVAPATAGKAIDSTTKIKFATKEAHGQVGIYAILKTPSECYEKRKFILLEDGDSVASQNGFSDAFIITDNVGLGDTVQMKAKTTHSDDGTKCKGSISKEFEIDHLESGEAG